MGIAQTKLGLLDDAQYSFDACPFVIGTYQEGDWYIEWTELLEEKMSKRYNPRLEFSADRLWRICTE